MRDTFAEVNLKNLKSNYLNIRKKTKTKILAVVKADAYGHGVKEVVNALEQLKNKPEFYGVAIAEEGEEVRKLKVKQSILVFNPFNKGNVDKLLANNLSATIFTKDHIRIILSALKNSKLNKIIKVHIKVDTGMNRLGIPWNEAIEFIRYCSKINRLKIEGVYTHFATSDEYDKEYANLQLKRFNDIIDSLKAENINYGLAHCANSGAIIDMPETYFDMVRPGISLYGYSPSLETSNSLDLKPVLSLFSKVSSIKFLPKGEPCSYSRRFYTKKDTNIASIPIGYADGFSRSFTNKAKVIINNKMYNQVGTVTMDRILVDINNDKIKEGDKVILLGKTKTLNYDGWEWSKILNTIPYEVTCNISKRVPRKYVG